MLSALTILLRPVMIAPRIPRRVLKNAFRCTAVSMFNVDYLYDEIAQPDGDAPLDLDTFFRIHQRFASELFNATRGEEIWFTKEDMRTVEEVAAAFAPPRPCRSSHADGHDRGDTYVDGALDPMAESLDAPMRGGYTASSSSS